MNIVMFADDNNPENFEVPFSADEKFRIGKGLISRALKTIDLSGRHNVARRTFQKYGTVIRRGGMLYRTGGRPPLIDEQGFSHALDYVFGNPGCSDDELNDLANYEHQETYRRKHRIDEDVNIDIPPLRKNTRLRFHKKLKVMMAEQENEDYDDDEMMP
jgi:hypothetical protein